MQTQFLVDDIVKRGLKKIAILADRSGCGDAGLKDLEAAITKAGLPPPAVVRFKVGAKWLADELKELKYSGPDALLGWTLGPKSRVISAGRIAMSWDCQHSTGDFARAQAPCRPGYQFAHRLAIPTQSLRAVCC